MAEFAIVNQGSYIGENAVVGQHCILRKGSVLEAGAVVQRQADIANSIFQPGASIHSGFVGDSIIGADCRIGAGFITANKRFDRASVAVSFHGSNLETTTNALGVVMGAQTKVGIHAGTMPGVLLPESSTVMPGEIVKRW